MDHFFNLFTNDIILFLNTLVTSNYADDKNLYVINKDKEEGNWFALSNLFMILSTGKCHYMCIPKDLDDNDTLHISS